ncbi:bifunctional [glutamine synthetase] adenylyltransferase/[glutamine synthetase]-adenylyl-L-tyrosine phosphorylase [Mobiluncus sp.]|uniref:bifunctional [glutamine synthetase] adenylyltransferase/[glutamine synthetase]-adenylyl-L-tyrosine phosphorylase n=1 Tax=Mobiluncus sp. TaxID=47293 RepID=UPI002A9155B1|nr:bifunctional [glutamine synthetase] adenylyltransferase/[glutamine synthetase]-adenylyl-L-tyrosine phosphorylase [Mobiluncus sp.]MDY6076293.1 bifunctional [glutamine synthetase] adenylyltransferase/[glutamine synthetase]-adenylyl-L-tyrosine phosphorylase [Mobiluncus sp.]
MAREYSETVALLTSGVEDVGRTKTLLTAIMQAAPQIEIPRLIENLGQTADPDLVLLSLNRIFSEDARHPSGITATLSARQIGNRTLRLLGASEFFASYLVTHPAALVPLEQQPEPETYLTRLLNAVGAKNLGSDENPCWVADPQAHDMELRRVYYALLAQLAAEDLAHTGTAGAKAEFQATSRRISDLVDAALEASLALARRDHDPEGQIAFTVVAMGKTGARELNYISDVDVIYVGQARDGADLDSAEANRRATTMAQALGSYCSATGPEPALWVLDTALRPEGKDGALVRTLESHLDYYQRWAKTWEFQALLKARPAAGDRELGARYLSTIRPFVWSAVEREGFVEDTRAMRRRVEKLLDPKKAGREIKLGAGGLRDVEFTVQLLQLVHGRVDESLRVRATLDALQALIAGGYIGREQGEEMADYYRFLRVIEHRTQLDRMRRTHLFPQDAQLRRVARSIDVTRFSEGEKLTQAWQEVRQKVRGLHEEIYYRPLLPAMAKLSAGVAALDSAAAQSRLQAIGYRDSKRALEHIEALTTGVSRRAAIQRQLLPVLLDWLADGVDPDGGLLAFRQVSDALGDTHWYLGLLRDSGTAARSLTRLLSSSPLVAGLLPANPDAIKWLDDESQLRGRTREELEREILASFERQPDLDKQAVRLRAVRGRELLRAAMVDVLQGIDPLRTAQRLTDVGEAVLAGALDLALRKLNVQQPPTAPGHQDGGEPQSSQVAPATLATPSTRALASGGYYADHLVVGMGRFGGGESGYASDADVVFYYRPWREPGNPAAGYLPTAPVAESPAAGTETDPAASEIRKRAAAEAASLVNAVSSILNGAQAGAWRVDTDLRPEGRSGPVSKDLGLLEDYFARWASAWERQALLRARPVVGSPALRTDFAAIVDPVRFDTPPEAKELKEIRRLKARMEAERIGGGQVSGAGKTAAAVRHVKLGPGGLSDVEWSVQLLQMCHASDVPGLRCVSTGDALRSAVSAGLIPAPDAEKLRTAWMMAMSIRAANVLGSGRTTGKKLDVLPVDRLLVTTAALLGYAEGAHQDLTDDWMRTARLARGVVEQIFYD